MKMLKMFSRQITELRRQFIREDEFKEQPAEKSKVSKKNKLPFITKQLFHRGGLPTDLHFIKKHSPNIKERFLMTNGILHIKRTNT